jgi:hypothetical protein
MFLISDAVIIWFVKAKQRTECKQMKPMMDFCNINKTENIAYSIKLGVVFVLIDLILDCR